MNIFFTSDTHYHHKNIVRGCSTWGKEEGSDESDVHSEQNTRDFDTLEEHDEKLVNNINSVVKDNDILYHLGDWSFGGFDQIWEFRRRINCNNIHLVLGNHDHHIERNKNLNVDAIPGIERFREITHLVFGGTTRSLFKSVDQYIMNRKIGGKSMCLSHFAQRVWDKGHHGNWNLYGHSHNTLSDYVKGHGIFQNPEHKFKCMDVGVDTHPEFRPYHFDEIAAIMKNRINLLVDHHTSKTN